MTKLDEQRLTGKLLAQEAEVLLVRGRALEGPRELGEQRVVLARRFERRDRIEELAVDRRVARGLVRHRLVELDDEPEPGRRLLLHQLERPRRRDAVVGGVHLDDGEPLGVIVQEVTGLHARRVERTDPVRERITRGADQDLSRGHDHSGRGTVRDENAPNGTCEARRRWRNVAAGTTATSPSLSRTRSSAWFNCSDFSPIGNRSICSPSGSGCSADTVTPTSRNGPPFQFSRNNARATSKIRCACWVCRCNARWRMRVVNDVSLSRTATTRPT